MQNMTNAACFMEKMSEYMKNTAEMYEDEYSSRGQSGSRYYHIPIYYGDDSYMRGDEYMMRGGDSYRRGGGSYGRGGPRYYEQDRGYSRHGNFDDKIKDLERQLEMADSEKERRAIMAHIEALQKD